MGSGDAMVGARGFIADVPLPDPPPRTRAPAGTEPDPAVMPTLAVAANLVEFGPGAAPELRAAVTDALLLAQLATDRKGADTPDLWYEGYRDVLGHVGFRSTGLTRTAQDFSSTDAELHEAILPVVTAAFAGAAVPALILETLRQLSEASAGKPWITLFERESRRFDARQFQISMVDGDASQQTVTMLGFAMDIAQSSTQVLFFRHARDSVAVERVEGKFAAESATLVSLAPDFSSRLADRRQAYIAALEI